MSTKNKSLVSKVKENLKYHLVDTTALLASANPLFSAMEVGIAGMSDEVSINSKITIAAISYLGMGFAFSRGRDLSRKFFKISDKTKEKVQIFHDIAYTATFNLVMSPIIYSSMGADLEQSIIGGVSSAGISIVIGPLSGYSVDVARDLTGLKDCDRISYPKAIKKQKPSLKKGLAGLLVAGSILTMAGIYSLTPNDQDYIIPLQNPSSQVINQKEYLPKTL